MKTTVFRVLGAALAFGAASLVLAQSSEPPKMVRIYREDVKPGRSAAHEKVETGYVRAFSKTSYPRYIALENFTGEPQAWFLEPYESYAAMEEATHLAQSEPLKTQLEQLDAMDGEVRSGGRVMIATYRKELSYLPGPSQMAKARYVMVNQIRIRPGRNTEFTEMRKIINGAFEKTESKQRRVVYGVTSGAPTGTFLIISAMQGLKDLDATGPMTMNAAFGSNLERYLQLIKDVVLSSEMTTFSVNPRMSNPAKEFIEADPNFWAPKPAVKTATRTKTGQ
jgi:hypothetical protein